MAVVTAAQIKALLDTALAGQNVRVYDYLKPPTRQVMPFVEILNAQPQGNEADARVTNIIQKFDVTLKIKVRGAGSDETARQKVLEDLILPALDDTALGINTIFVFNRNWTRSQQPQPILHYESTLGVAVTDTTSTTGAGTVGGLMTITIDTLADMAVLDKPAEKQTDAFENIFNDTRNRTEVSPIGDIRSFFVEVEAGPAARLTGLRGLVNARAAVSCTLKRPGQSDEVFNAKVVDLSNPAPFGNIETVIVQLERF